MSRAVRQTPLTATLSPVRIRSAIPGAAMVMRLAPERSSTLTMVPVCSTKPVNIWTVYPIEMAASRCSKWSFLCMLEALFDAKSHVFRTFFVRSGLRAIFGRSGVLFAADGGDWVDSGGTQSGQQGGCAGDGCQCEE